MLWSMLTAVVVCSDTCHHAVCYVFLWIFHNMRALNCQMENSVTKTYMQFKHKYTEIGRVKKERDTHIHMTINGDTNFHNFARFFDCHTEQKSSYDMKWKNRDGFSP